MAFNVAPTDEMVLIGLMMTEWHAIALVAGSLLLMHAFVYAVEFRGTSRLRAGVPFTSEFLRLTMVAYALSLLISLYVLWTFGRTDGLGACRTGQGDAGAGLSVGAGGGRRPPDPVSNLMS